MGTETSFDWIAVSFLSSGSGSPFGAKDRIGAVVRVGIRMPDEVREVELPVLLDAASERTLAQLRDQAVVKAARLLRALVRDLQGQTYDELSARQDRQDDEREKGWQESFESQVFGAKSVKREC